MGGENSRPTVLTSQQATNSDKQILYVSGYKNNTDCSTFNILTNVTLETTNNYNFHLLFVLTSVYAQL